MLKVVKRKTKKVTNLIKLDDGIIIENEMQRIKIVIYSEAIIRVMCRLDGDFIQKKSVAVIGDKIQCDWKLIENTNEIILKTNRMQLVVNRETSQFLYFDNDGNLLVKEPCNDGKTLQKFDIYRTVVDENTLAKKVITPDGEKTELINPKKVFDKASYHTKLKFVWAEDEAIYGLGQHEEGVMNLRGTNQYVYQTNLKIAMPVIVSTKGYGFLVDTDSYMLFNDDVFGSYLYTDADDEMDFYFIYGGNIDGVVAGYRSLTGQVPMLPKWSFGYIQSFERYENSDELVDTIKEYRKQQIPIDCIVLDWSSWEEGMWGQKTFDLSRFPNMRATTDELHNLGAKLVVSIWPNMDEKSPDYKEMREKDFIIEGTNIYKANVKEARLLYWKQANEGIFSEGVDGFWCDASEPFSPDWASEILPVPQERLKLVTDVQKEFLGYDNINSYSTYQSMGIYEGQRETTNKKRVFNLTRSAYLGQQRYSTIAWSGDICANWETLKNQIPAGLNFCMTGIPYWTLDIGAFFVKKGKQWFWNGEYDQGTDDFGYRELYTRWFQFGCFLPIFRSHGTDCSREVWQFGKKGDMFYDTLVKFINLRYKLMPYIYSIAAMVTKNSYTMLRALVFDFPYDVNTYNIKDQFMFGTSLMICPVTEPMYYDKNNQKIEDVPKTREVYLPKGTNWYDFWTNRKFKGGQKIVCNAEIEIIPIFVKEGSIVPIGNVIQHTGEHSDITFNVYSGSNGEFSLYDDFGDNYNYENGEFLMVELGWIEKEKELKIINKFGDYKSKLNLEQLKVNIISET
jgi:alpha-D-xyloside xylohydrolase